MSTTVVLVLVMELSLEWIHLGLHMLSGDHEYDSMIAGLHGVLSCLDFPSNSCFQDSLCMVPYSHHIGWQSMHSFRLRHLFYIFDKEQLYTKKFLVNVWLDNKFQGKTQMNLIHSFILVWFFWTFVLLAVVWNPAIGWWFSLFLQPSK